jgi:hypothetical protein
MITAKLKQILIDSGCTLVFYEQDKLANLYVDQSDQFDVVGLIVQPNDLILEVKANAIHEHYNPLTIEIMKQVKLEDQADNNEVVLQALLDICKQIIVRIIDTGEYKTQAPYTVSKIPENKYDANVIGWSISLNLYYLLNENRNPCL